MRFAPSPTGLFHIGNLRTAWISHELSRKLKLPWIVRFEDIDRPRVVAGAREAQLSDLAKLGLIPDTILIQSHFHDRHRALFETARKLGQVYPCTCSRREILESLASAPHDAVDSVYTGHCRNLAPDRPLPDKESVAWRFKQPSSTGTEDFIIARTGSVLKNGGPDGESFIPAYHWACAIDDYDGGYDWLVRCQDLLPAARIQRSLHSWLSAIEGARKLPLILHTSLVVDHADHRLEKRSRGARLDEIGITPARLIDRFAESMDWSAFTGTSDHTEARAQRRLGELTAEKE